MFAREQGSGAATFTKSCTSPHHVHQETSDNREASDASQQERQPPATCVHT